MKYAVKFFLDTDGFTNWDDDQIEDPDITFTIVRFPSIEEAKKAVNQDFIDFRDDPGFYSNDTVRSCNGRWLVANDMKMFGGTAVPGEEEGFAVSYEVSGDCDYASMIIESVSPASEEDETHMESDLEEGCIEGVFICEDSHCNTEQSQKYTDTDSDPFLGGRSLDNYLSDCNELGLLPAIDDIYERYGADGLEKAASMVRSTYYNDEMVSTIPNYLEAGYDLEKIKEYALISPSIAYELQSYIATINDNDEEEKYSEDLYRFCSVEMKQNNEKYEYTWCGWYIEEDLVNDLMFAVEQIEDNDNDDDYIGALKRIIRLWQPEMFTKYGLNKMAEQLIELLNSEYLEEFWDDPDFYFKQYLKEYANFVKDLIPILNEYVAKGSVNAAQVLMKAFRAGKRSYFADVTNFTIPECITEIPLGTFYGCTRLTDITIPAGVTKIGEQAFFDCINLSAAVLPEGLKKIESLAFAGCERFSNVIIPKGVINISHRAYIGCTNLRSVTLPIGVKIIGEDVFKKCDSLETIFVPAKKTEYYKKRLPSELWDKIVELDNSKK